VAHSATLLVPDKVSSAAVVLLSVVEKGIHRLPNWLSMVDMVAEVFLSTSVDDDCFDQKFSRLPGRVNTGYMGILQKNRYNELFLTKTAKVYS